MTVNELKEKLDAKGVPSHRYSLTGGLPHDAHCLCRYGDIWQCYYSERGEKSNIHLFNSEDEACRFICGKIILNI